MSTLWNKLWCVILSLAILVNLLPVSALAADAPMEQVVAQHWVEDPPVEATEDTIQPLEILSEDTSKRGEYYKEFVLTNGLRMASMYAEPVHYSEDGQWKEIDNTLKLASGAYTNTAGKWKVSFPQQLTKDKAVTITKDGYTLSFFMAGELYQETTSLIRAALGTVTQQQPVQLQSFQTATAQLQAVKQPELQEGTVYPQAPVEKSHARLEYANVSHGTDIVYDLKGNQVKESIIMDAYSARLQGYRYTLNVGELNPVLTDSGEINLYDRDSEEIVMVMPAPFLMDDAGEYCYDVEVNLTGKGSQYTLTYLLPQQWLAASERQWPVVLDPMVEADITRTNIRDVSVYEQNTPHNHNAGVLDVGHNTTYGVMRSFLKYRNLPSLSSADVVVYAQLNLLKPNDNSTSNPIEIHKVLQAWESETMTWSNQPSFNPLVEDYSIVEDTGYYSWDITDVVRGWYEGENTGLMLKAPNWVENTTSTTSYRKQFMSSDYSEYVRPILTMAFHNTNGLESYWDYTSSSAGRAGTGSINDYTGNLVWTHSDIGFGGNLMPVSISHIYNANDSAKNEFDLGYGWRTNYHQQLKKVTFKIQGENKVYYAWTDADGTVHYFDKDKDGKYVDEDNPELTLTVGSDTQHSTIKNKEGSTSYFDSQGRLCKLENNQSTKSSITITYSGDTNRITQITDGANREYHFAYNEDNLLETISYHGTGETGIVSVCFDYDNGCLTQAIDQDNESSHFTYCTTQATKPEDQKRLLLTAQDIDGYKLTYTYTTQSAGKPSRVKTVTESHNGETGSSLTLTYAHNQTTFTDNLGNVQIKQFNNCGNTTAVQDDEGRAQFANYASNDPSESGKANQLLLSSKLQNTVGNMINNSSFEGTNVWGAINATSSLCTTQAYLGSKSMQFAKEGSATTGYVTTGTCTAEVGATYTFSAYVKTGPNASAYLTVGTDTSIVSETLPANQNWTRLQVSYTNTGSSNVAISAKVLTKTAGTVYVDCVQLEKAETASRYNIIENGDFRFGSNDWIMSEYCDSTEVPITLSAAPASELNRTAFRIIGDPSHKLRIRQEVPVSGQEGDTFVLAGWARGDGTPLGKIVPDGRRFTLRGTFLNTDGTTDEFEFHFNPDTGGELVWQYAAGVMVAKKAFSGIKVQVLYDFGANTIYFDGIQLYKEEFGNSYTYDEEGKITSVKDLQGKVTSYEYANNNIDLLKVIQDNKAKVTYTYDSYHNVTKATTEKNVVYEFTYDEYGNNTSVSITSGDQNITSTADYSEDGNRLEFTTDALGQITTYGYNPDTNVLDWVQYPGDTPETRTEYTYDAMYRTATAALKTDTGLNLSAQYTYDDDLLTSIKTASTTYNFTYGNFALRGSVAVGNKILASYDYQDGTNWLERLDYGNQDFVEYTYDDQGRVTQQIYEDDSYVTYKYDNNSALAKVYDSKTGTTSTYYYDFTDRVMKYVETSSTGTHSVGYTYDSLNNLTALTETFGDTVRKFSYAYDGDNRPTSITAGNSFLGYAYDAYGRVSSLTTKHDSNTFATKTYTYKLNADGTPTNQVSTVTIQIGSNSTTYTYTYDKNGNITAISDGTYTTSYAYDSANQLIREENQEANKITLWTYDNAGNILTRTVYPYTPGAEDEETKTDYYYTDTQWGDLLTAYNGVPITHDGIGNPLNDGTWSYTWQHGRQLASMTKLDGSAQWNYTYNADGMRTKRTNGTTTYQYTYRGGQLTHMTVDGHTMYFTYDASGTPLNMVYDGLKFYYITNLQGDVIAIVNGNGQEFVRYTYDAWGNVTATGSATNLRFYNPLRYRGYVYDEETGLYYVSSRYYNPEIGRFLNADSAIGQIGNVQGANMFTYCFNNPVNMSDPTGNWPKLSTFWLGVAVAAAVVAAVAVTVVSCGAAAPVVAALGGTLVSAASATAAVTSIAYAACSVAIAATAVSAAALVQEEIAAKSNTRSHSVYVLKDSNDQVQYVGRTVNIKNRAAAHSLNPSRADLEMEVVATGLTRSEARALEQAGMLYHHTINTANKTSNQINGVAPKYWDPMKTIARGTLDYTWNQMTNEILYWTGC